VLEEGLILLASQGGSGLGRPHDLDRRRSLDAAPVGQWIATKIDPDFTA
jgi:hypothetical protein